MAAPAPPASSADLIARLAAEPGAARRSRLLAAVPALHTIATVELLADEATRLARVDLRQATRLAAAADTLSARLGDAYAAGRSARANGHVHAIGGDSPAALACYEQALERFAAAERDIDLAITLSGELQTLIYLGRYADAHARADRARAIFERHGDRLRLARLDSNVGNVFYRQDRFEEALASYERALAGFADAPGSPDVAVTLRNVAVCQISLQRFEAALATYTEARAWCDRHGLVRLVAEVDYNIAYLHYLRGEYATAIDLYAAARVRAGQLDDHYHAALCDLDEAELYLELNLVPEGAALAERAAAAFRRLHLRYEEAKAVTSLAFSASREHDLRLALTRFDRARAAFVLEENQQWPASIDLSKALVLQRARQPVEARRLCLAARRHFAATPLTARTTLCDLLLARLALAEGDVAAGDAAVRSALDLLGGLDAPALRYQAQYLAGQVAEAQGDPVRAEAAYRLAHAAIETLRSHLDHDELKVAFLEDKLAVFTALASLALDRPGGAAEAFAWIERAKSRSLAEHVALQAGQPDDQPARRQLAAEIQTLAQRLTAILHQQREEGRRSEPAAATLASLDDQARVCDRQLAQAIAALEQAGGSVTSALGPATVPLTEIQASLPAGMRLLQYATLRGQLHVWVVDGESIEHVALGPADGIQAIARLLRFQVDAAARDAASDASAPVRPALAAHLATLYDRLVRPVAPRLAGATHLVVLPNDVLHAIPFHALDTGDGPLVDRATVSYAPSASVHHHAGRARPVPPDLALIVARPDPLAPAIADEARRIAARLPGARLALGDAATRDTLAAIGPRCRIVHLAAHGHFRRDNPMYSSIQLADGDLTVRDLAALRLSAELVTLSGCSTGLSVATGADELLGLARSLLYAGARAVLVSLWDVHDEAAAGLMDRLYARLAGGDATAEALAGAMRDLRQAHPNPFFWAPFILTGWSHGRIFPAGPSIFPPPTTAYRETGGENPAAPRTHAH